jgi:hypothetical protein
MARLNFTPNLERHLGIASLEVEGATLGEALDCGFRKLERARSYVLDDQGRVRHHIAVFVDGALVQDRARLAFPIGEGAEIWLMQALSGG